MGSVVSVVEVVAVGVPVEAAEVVPVEAAGVAVAVEVSTLSPKAAIGEFAVALRSAAAFTAVTPAWAATPATTKPVKPKPTFSAVTSIPKPGILGNLS